MSIPNKLFGSTDSTAAAALSLINMRRGSSTNSSGGETADTGQSNYFNTSHKTPANNGAEGAAAAAAFTPQNVRSDTSTATPLVRRAAINARNRMQALTVTPVTPTDKKGAANTPVNGSPASKRQKSDTTNPAVEAIRLWNDSFLPLTEKYLTLGSNGPIALNEIENLAEQTSILNKVIGEYSKADKDKFKDDIVTTKKMLTLVVRYFNWRLDATIDHKLSNDAYKKAIEAKAAADSEVSTSSKKEQYNLILNNLSAHIFHIGDYNDVIVLKCEILLELYKIELDENERPKILAKANELYEQIPCPNFLIPN